MTKEKFIYGLNACAVTYHNGQKMYEHDDLVKCFEDLEIFEQKPTLDKIRAEIKTKIEEEEFARSVFRHEEKDTVKAEQCTGSIMAYNNVIKFIDKYMAESEE